MNRDVLIAQIQLSTVRAQWWMAYANTAANKGRIVRDGGGRQLTPDDLVKDAMETSNAHIRIAQEMMDALNTIPPTRPNP